MSIKNLGIGFAAGFIATLVFHQIAVLILHSVGISPFGAWNMTPAPPLGVPAVLSLSFWGGVWGILYILDSSSLRARRSLLGQCFPVRWDRVVCRSSPYNRAFEGWAIGGRMGTHAAVNCAYRERRMGHCNRLAGAIVRRCQTASP